MMFHKMEIFKMFQRIDISIDVAILRWVVY